MLRQQSREEEACVLLVVPVQGFKSAGEWEDLLSGAGWTKNKKSISFPKIVCTPHFTHGLYSNMKAKSINLYLNLKMHTNILAKRRIIVMKYKQS